MIEGTFTVSSTLDNTTGLLSKYFYNEGIENLPIVVLIHGYNLTIDAISDAILKRIANQGYFAVAIGMRGRKGASGNRDASIRELHDIYDGINYIKSNFPVSNKVAISGYSGGAGNALGFAVKFPFVANTIVNHFGMVDYGYHDIESWYARNDQYHSGIVGFVGHERIPSNMNYYRSRNAHESLKNVQAKIFSYHDSEDTGVDSLLTTYLTEELLRLDKPYETHISTPIDSVRYLHNMNASKITEPDWLPHVSSTIKPNMANTGTFRVTGYIVTDAFKVLLGALDNHVADVSFNLQTNEFSITPLTGQMQVVIEMGALQQTINVTKPTTFIFNGEDIPDEPILEDEIVKKMFIKQSGEYNLINNVFVKSSTTWNKIKTQ